MKKDQSIEILAEKLHIDIMNAILKVMERDGISKRELSKRTGLSLRKITNLFSYGKLIDLVTLAKIQASLNVTKDDLLLKERKDK